MEYFGRKAFVFVFTALLTTSLADGNCGSDVANKTISWILLNETYCLVNNCTVRIKDSDTLLDIINSTGEWIIVANDTNLFTISASNDTSCDCEDPSLNFFIFITTISFLIFIASSSNVVLHMVVKELRTIAGIIVIEICITVIISGICQMLTALPQHVYQVNEDTAICAVMKYAITAASLLYTITKAIYLFHFAYLMYGAFRPRPNTQTHENKKLLYIYGIVDITTVILCTVLVIVTDLLYERTAFNTDNGYCTDSFHDLDDSVSNKVLLTVFLLMSIVQIIFFVLALTFYCLATKQQLWVSSTGKQSSIRVSVTLMSSIALGALLLVVLLLAGVGGESSIISAGVAVFVEQTVLFIVFLTSKKVRAKMKCCYIENDIVPLLRE